MKQWLALILALALLLCGCGVTVPPETTVTEPVDTTTVPQDTQGVEQPQWTLTGDWKMDGEALTAPGQENAQAVREDLILEDGWTVTVQIEPDKEDARLLLCTSGGNAEAGVTLRHDGSKLKLSVDEWKLGKWKSLKESDKRFSYDKGIPLELQVVRYADRSYIMATISQEGEVLGTLRCADISVRDLSKTKKVGVGAEGKAVFSGLTIESSQRPQTPMEQVLATTKPEDEGYYLAIARQAVDDMLGNFWTGDTQTGKIQPTNHGFAERVSDPRGSTWETAMLYFEVYDMWAITGEEYYHDLVKAEAKFFRENFNEEEMELAGGNNNWASDDCAWNALMFLSFYTITGDMWFVDRAIGLLDSVVERWYDEELNGIRYKDGVDFMSMYETGIAWSWLQIWEITGQQRFYDLALRSYEGMHDRLGAGRDDGLYYCEANAHFPRGEVYRIGEAGSASFLTGNMCMAALSAKFYRLTGNQEYLDRVYKINEGLLRYYDNDGVLLNDRDAWTNGTFAAFYASEVLTLPDTEEMQQLLKNTATSIVTNARTDDGYYGGSWSGPAEGSGSAWYNGGSVPEQSMTTGTSILMVTAAAVLEAGIERYIR